jgi:exodeoxyribonuclease VII small subunit
VPKKGAQKARGEPKYEDVRARLEQVVDRLESGEESLEGSLALYEEGVKLVRAAHARLEAAEKKLEILKPRPDGTFALEPGEAVIGPSSAGKPDGALDEDED